MKSLLSTSTASDAPHASDTTTSSATAPMTGPPSTTQSDTLQAGSCSNSIMQGQSREGIYVLHDFGVQQTRGTRRGGDGGDTRR
jgi:hypothetical protein